MSHCEFKIVSARLFRAVLLGLALALPGLRSEAAPKDYLVDIWRFDDDLPRDGIISISQGSDGYLWVSSWYGLARFDGVRFNNLTPQFGPQFLGYHFANLFADRSGAVWIAIPGEGLMQWRDGRLLSCMAPGNPILAPVSPGLTNAQGRPLAMTVDGRLLGWSNGVTEVVATVNRWGDPIPQSLCQDTHGRIWFAIHVPDENSRRVGQAVAAASLPEVNKARK